jgi:hypothetical protein
MSDRPVARPLLNTGQHKHRKISTYQTSMPEVGFEPTITASERAKTVHALDHSATVTGHNKLTRLNKWKNSDDEKNNLPEPISDWRLSRD